MTALLKVKAAGPVKPHGVPVSEETARAIAGAYALPNVGAGYAVFWGKIDDQVVDTLSLNRSPTGYFLQSTKYPVTAWPEIFKIEVEEIT